MIVSACLTTIQALITFVVSETAGTCGAVNSSVFKVGLLFYSRFAHGEPR